jgi:Protein of unknown function (DUF3277)
MNTYSFVDVSASLNGPTGTVDLGYGSAVADEGITTEMVGEKNTMLTGADGRVMHSLHAENSARVTVRLLKVSPINQILMGMFDAQALVSGLWGQNVIVIRQIQSGDITTASQCAFRRRPNISYAKDGDIVNWEFDCGGIATVLGKY